MEVSKWWQKFHFGWTILTVKNKRSHHRICNGFTDIVKIVLVLMETIMFFWVSTCNILPSFGGMVKPIHPNWICPKTHCFHNAPKQSVWILQVMTEEDPSSPISMAHIGPEKLLSLFSKMNWNDYCLSYLLTDRDFSGVLGLAWEGKAGNISAHPL